MSSEQFKREMSYQLIKYVVEKMLSKGILTEKESSVICTKSGEKYCPIFSVLY